MLTNFIRSQDERGENSEFYDEYNSFAEDDIFQGQQEEEQGYANLGMPLGAEGAKPMPGVRATNC